MVDIHKLAPGEVLHGPVSIKAKASSKLAKFSTAECTV